MTVGRVTRTRRMLTGSAGGNLALASWVQALVADGLYDWIASDPYGRSVIGTAGLVAYYRLGIDNQASGLLDAYGTAVGTPKNGVYSTTGVTYGVAGPAGTGADTAVQFNGISGGANVALNLSPYANITVEFWLKWTAFSNNDALAMEFSPNFQSTPFGFLIDPNSSISGGGFWELSVSGSAGQSSWTMTRPSAGAFHHYAFVFGLGSPDTCTAYVDGVRSGLNNRLSVSNAAQTFANTTLYLMCRNMTTLWGNGVLDELAIYGTALTAAQVAGHYAQR